MNTDSIFSITEGGATLEAVLHRLLDGQKVTIEEIHNKIILLPVAGKKAPDKYSLYGYIMEEGSQEPLAYATVKDLETSQVTQANRFGYYNIMLTQGKHYLEVKPANLPPKIFIIALESAVKKNLVVAAIKLPETKIEAGNILQQDGGSRVDKYQTDAYNNFLGEADPVRSLYLMPGNIETQETTGKLVVRGGDPDQSIFLLDGNQVFNPSHLLGEISIVNSTLVKSIRQYKNDFPSRFDGAISSVTEVNTRDGNMEKWTAEGNAGLLAGAISLEGPLIKNTTAMMFSMRHSWSNPLLNIIDDNYRLRFYDIHFKLTHLINANNKLMFTGYLGKDRLNLHNPDVQYIQRWGNRLGTLNWLHLLGSRSFVSTTLNASNYSNLAGVKFTWFNDSTQQMEESDVFNNKGSIEKLEAKTQFEFNSLPNVRFRFGSRYAHTTIRPFTTQISLDFLEETGDYQPIRPFRFEELSAYFENEWRIGSNLLIRPGFHLTYYKFRDYTHPSLQPRLFAAYRINQKQQLTLSYAQMAQYLHQVSSPLLDINSEFWVPSTKLLRPVESIMINAGYNLNDKNGFYLSADAYYKVMRNLTNFAEKGNIFYNGDLWEQDILAGNGCSYGLELLSRKQVNKWQLQLSYALTYSDRQFPGINDGKRYPFRYDRRHNLNVAITYSPLKNLDLNAVWYFSSGDARMLPDSTETTYQFKRLKPYHRLNLNASYTFQTDKQLSHKISAGLYNAYQARNKYSPDLAIPDNSSYNAVVPGSRLFDLTFYLSYSFKF